MEEVKEIRVKVYFNGCPWYDFCTFATEEEAKTLQERMENKYRNIWGRVDNHQLEDFMKFYEMAWDEADSIIVHADIIILE